MTARSLALLALTLLLAARGAAAQDAAETHICLFTQECYETEACADAAFEITLEIEDGFADRAVQGVTVAETLTGTAYPIGEGGWMAQLGSQIGPALLTLHDGAARLSMHGGTEAMMINYSGTCEAQD